MNKDTIRILVALIDANLDNIRTYPFDGYHFEDDEAEKYQAAFKDGARTFLNRLKEQLKEPKK